MINSLFFVIVGKLENSVLKKCYIIINEVIKVLDQEGFPKHILMFNGPRTFRHSFNDIHSLLCVREVIILFSIDSFLFLLKIYLVHSISTVAQYQFILIILYWTYFYFLCASELFFYKVILFLPVHKLIPFSRCFITLDLLA